MIDIACLNCKKVMQISQCRVGRTRYCSVQCTRDHKKEQVLSRVRDCAVCGAKFTPRRNQLAKGIGKYCSVKCRNSVSINWLLSEESRKKSYETAKKNGFPAAKKMLAHENTLAMQEARKLPKDELRRRTNERLKKYRKAVQEKTREWSQTRRVGKIGRLPNGWVSTLKVLQRHKCAVCATSIKNAYHVDHRMPIAKGGKHEKTNIQLLCPSCNVRKSAKDPIAFMQERGFLL